MSANTKIEWADHTFNPWIGCTKVSPGCDNCYAKADFDDRKHRVIWGPGQARSRTKTWGDPIKWNAQHAAFFAEHGRRQRVFCASLADVFDNEVPTDWRRDLFDLIERTPALDWLLLTKRIGNARAMLEECYFGRWADCVRANIWLGATIVNPEEALRDIPKLLTTPASVRFLSIEPLLGRIDLYEHLDIWWNQTTGVLERGERTFSRYGNAREQDPRINWVIVGGESGPGVRPMNPDWARSLRDQCEAAGVPFLFKQWGEYGPATEGFARNGDVVHEYGVWSVRMGKKAAGRLLDGRTWDQVPS